MISLPKKCKPISKCSGKLKLRLWNPNNGLAYHGSQYKEREGDWCGYESLPLALFREKEQGTDEGYNDNWDVDDICDVCSNSSKLCTGDSGKVIHICKGHNILPEMIVYLKDLERRLLEQDLLIAASEVMGKITHYKEMENKFDRWIRLTMKNVHKYIGHRVRYKSRGQVKINRIVSIADSRKSIKIDNDGDLGKTLNISRRIEVNILK